MKSKHSSFVCLQVIPQYIAYSSKSEKNRRLLIITPFKIYVERFSIQKLFIFSVFLSLRIRESKRLLYVTQLENHGLNHADD